MWDIWEKLEFLWPVADVPPLAWPSSGAPGDTQWGGSSVRVTLNAPTPLQVKNARPPEMTFKINVGPNEKLQSAAKAAFSALVNESLRLSQWSCMNKG